MLQAQQILDAHWDGQLPINPGLIAQRLGIEVRSDPSMAESGMIEMQPDGRAVISVNSSQFGPRQSFTIAHEIGHYVLGHVNTAHRLCRDLASNFSTGTFIPVEREANKFAAALLMPERLVRFAIDERKFTTLASLAALFGVSEVAMRWRLVNLGILNGV